jgi:hypothetical protein
MLYCGYQRHTVGDFSDPGCYRALLVLNGHGHARPIELYSYCIMYNTYSTAPVPRVKDSGNGNSTV